MKNCSEKETSDCGCTGKGQFHQEIDSLWPEMPDELKDMMRSLHQQKKAVLEKVKISLEKY